MCNCGSNHCNNCKNGQPCNCPPNYNILPAPVPCQCCPPGATYTSQSVNFPNGQCTDQFGNNVPTINCVTCIDSTLTDCVTYQLNPGNPITCFGIASGDSLTTILQKICANLASTVLSQLSNSSTLQTILCNLISSCPPSRGGTPVVIVKPYCCPQGYTYFSPAVCNVLSYPNGCCQEEGQTTIAATPC